MLDLLGGLALELGDAVWDLAAGTVGWLFGFLADMIILLSAALPDGDLMQLPQVIGQWETGLGWLNWWMPVGQLVALLTTWVAATVAYYVFQYILRVLANR